MTTKNMKKIVACVERGEGNNKRSYWTMIGVAFVDRDGSLNHHFDFYPTSPSTTIQTRDFDPKTDE